MTWEEITKELFEEMTEKQFNVFDVDGTIFLEDHKKGSYHIGEIENVDVNCLNDIADRLNELQINCDKKQEHIVVLENKIRRMREAIHKLEWLATHRNADLTRENEQLKFQNSNLMKEVAEYSRKTKELDNENKQLKDLLKSMADRNNEIWLDDGQIIRLNKIFNGEWIND